MRIELFFDGACSNNGNKLMGVGLSLVVKGEEILGISQYLGRGTSNIAEWSGLVLALKATYAYLAQEGLLGNKDVYVVIHGDSQLIVRQFNGEYACKKREFVPYYKKARKLFEEHLKDNIVTVIWVRREKNKRADVLSKQELKLVEAELEAKNKF